jgi:hypothetical protein
MNKYMKKILFLSVALLAVGLTSCEDEPDKYEVADGVPVVNYIRCLSSEVTSNTDDEDTKYTNGELVESAYPSSTLCLVGENLRSVVKVFFNDLEANLNTSYITDHTLIVNVPGSVPTEVSDKMYLITSSGQTVEVDFKVIISAPSVASMSCEYAPAGSRATIYGGYMIDDPNTPLTVMFKNAAGQDLPATDLEVADDYSSVTFTVPEGAVEGPITVTSVYGATQAPFRYMDSRGMLFDFDGATGLGNHGWHDREILSDETSITGKFVQLGNGTAKLSENADWDDANFSFEYWCGSWDTPQNITSGEGIALNNLVDFTNYENMSLKFELFIPKASPWMAGAMQICFEGLDKVTISGNPIDGYAGTVAAANAHVFNNEANDLGKFGRAMYRPWTTTGSFDTNDQWITVTMPFSSFIYDKDGGVTSNTPKLSDFTSLSIFVLGGGIPGTECTPIIKIDNIRAVPNK